MHLVLAAEACEFFTGNVKRHCFVHCRSCLKTFELANVRQYRTMQSKVTRFRRLCKALKSLRRLTLGLQPMLGRGARPVVVLSLAPVPRYLSSTTLLNEVSREG